MASKNISDQTAIYVNGVAKYFSPSKGQRSIKQAFTSMFSSKKDTIETDGYWALKDINFEINKGEFFGIVGRNGSGKSTLLKMIAGVYTPTKGDIKVNGMLVPFIELGVGFNAELSGRDNLYLNGALLGFSRKEITTMYEDIVAFAELEDHMDVKLKNFSSGMQVRLAFSIAIRAKSDILLIDEVLAVGDAAFQSKCFDYFQALRKGNTTVIFVSHDRASLERFCDRGVLINDGIIIESGSIRKVLKSYSKIVLEELEHTKPEDTSEEDKLNKVSSDYALIKDVKSYSTTGVSKKKFTFGDDIKISYNVEVKKHLVNPILGITIWQKNVDKPIFASNTLIEGVKETGTFKIGSTINFSVDVPAFLNDGEYYIEPAIANESASVFYDQQPKASTFFISGSANPYSILSSDKKINIAKSK